VHTHPKYQATRTAAKRMNVATDASKKPAGVETALAPLRLLLPLVGALVEASSQGAEPLEPTSLQIGKPAPVLDVGT